MMSARSLCRSVLAGALALLAGCTTPPPGGVQDPYEEQNRARFASNLAVDRAVVGPSARGYGSIVPDPVERGVSNFSANAGLPGDIVNDLLQANLEDAAVNVTRLLFNTTIGIGGLFDPMAAAGLAPRPSDFGETLYVWGVGEGNYVVLPFVGPSTERDAVGMVIDGFTNPLGYVLNSPESYAFWAADTGSTLSERNAADSTFSALILEAADPYAQARLLYLENRRFQLSGSRGASSDPYAGSDPYAAADPYAASPAEAAPAPYEDPYAF